MNAEQSRQHDTASPEFDWTLVGLSAPPWFLRLKVGWVESEIHQVERLLDDEFGISETTPIHAQHRVLLRERDALLERLAQPMASALHD